LNINGNYTNSGTFTHNSGTVTLRGGNISGTADTAFNNLTIIESTTPVTVTVNGTDDPTVAGTLDVDTGDTLSIGSDRTVTHTGAAMTLDGTISGAGNMVFTNTSSGPGTTGTLSSAVRYDATGGDIADTTFDARTYGGNVVAYSNVATHRDIFMGSGTHNFSGDLTVATGSSQSGVLTLYTYYTWDNLVAGNLAFSKGGIARPLIYSQGGSDNWTVSGNVDFTGGDFIYSSGILKMNGNNKTITTDGNILGFFESASASGYIQNVDALNVDLAFNLTSGEFRQGADVDVNVGGDFTLALGTTFTKASGTGLLVFIYDLFFTDSTSPRQDLGKVEIGTSPDTTTLTTDMTATAININNGDVLDTNSFDLDVGNGGVNIKSGGTLDATNDIGGDGVTTINTTGNFEINASGTFTDGNNNSIIIFDDTSGTDNLTTNGHAITNLTVDDGGGGSLTVDVVDDLVANGSVTINDGTLDVTLNNRNITVENNWLNSDIFTARSGTVTFNAIDAGNTINPGSSSFYNLTFNGVDGAWSPLTNTVTVTNDLLMKAGTFDTSSGTSNVTVNGHVQCDTTCGTINMTTTNTFTQSVSANKNFGTIVAVATPW
jgi:hypothetical protein